MANWIIAVKEIHTVEYYVTASSKEEAKLKFDDGEIDDHCDLDAQVDEIISIKEEEQ